MPPRTRQDVVVSFGGDASALNATLGRINSGMGSIARSAASVGSQIAAALGVGGALFAGGVGAGLSKVTKDLDELGKTAEGLNTTVEGLYALQFAIGQTSTLTDTQFNTSLQRLVKQIGQANRGVKESQKIFAELGVDVQRLAGLDADEAFVEIAEAVSRIPNAYTRASLAQKLFEDNWRALLPTLNEGEAGLRALIEQARGFGGPTTEGAEAAARLNDSIDRLNTQVTSLAYRYGPALIGWANDALSALTELGNSFDSINESIGPTRIRDINNEIGELRNNLRQIRTNKIKGFIYGDREPEILRQINDLEAERSRLIEEFAKKRQEERKQREEDLKQREEERRNARAAPDLPAQTQKTVKRGAEQKASVKKEEDDYKASIRARAAILDNWYRERAALQEQDAARVEKFQKAQEEALRKLLATGENADLTGFFRNLVGDPTKLPEAKLKVVMDEQSLADLPVKLQDSLQSGAYNLVLNAAVVPTLLVEGDVDSPLSRANDQAGGEP